MNPAIAAALVSLTVDAIAIAAPFLLCAVWVFSNRLFRRATQ